MLFGLYVVLLIILGLREAFQIRSVESFFVNGKKSGMFRTGISIIASCVGGSATIGMAGLAWQAGTPAFWWIGSGVCGLIILTCFLAEKVRKTGVHTMPELVSTFLGAPARFLNHCLSYLHGWPSSLHSLRLWAV